MLKLEEEPPLQSAKVQALGPPPQEIWEQEIVMTILSQMSCFMTLTQIVSLQAIKIKIMEQAASASLEMFQNSKSRTD